ncbi:MULTISPECIES: RNA-binding S4 domain-containing protein [Psychrobacter]|uniref:Heat shock protein 15 n=1 Tax=Psychrobacter fozii TaxID=198480 RepID=A0A2V4UDN9_9GAMM|nr:MULTISPECIES: S4 domain-containing protein [Psychrobacter]MBH0065389.1 RNA-binding protein [Psychrobacter sp. SZ93C1]MBH0086204.1 RNA-binding protein [Psychrobacter sp. SCQQ22]PYE38297.1 heat shock protein Hsp15 [Psychrobacter fozii]
MQNNTNSKTQGLAKIRLDKWLWAARFYRTRTLAKQAIEGGRVHYAGSRVKTSKEIAVGDELTIRQGSATAMTEKTVIVEALTTQRGNASAAEVLYSETDESENRRAYHAEQRKLANLARPDNKPNKKERRDIQRFKSKQD